MTHHFRYNSLMSPNTKQLQSLFTCDHFCLENSNLVYIDIWYRLYDIVHNNCLHYVCYDLNNQSLCCFDLYCMNCLEVYLFRMSIFSNECSVWYCTVPKSIQTLHIVYLWALALRLNHKFIILATNSKCRHLSYIVCHHLLCTNSACQRHTALHVSTHYHLSLKYPHIEVVLYIIW